jgi:hypothetical protein
MNKSQKNTLGSIVIFLASIGFAIFALNNVPQDEHAPIKKEKPQRMDIDYTFEDPISYRYPCAVKGTLRYCPKHKQKGEEVKKLAE